MRVEIRTRGITLDESLRELVNRRLTFALTRFGSRIRRVGVLLSDLNAGKGGIDKECQVEILLTGLDAVRIEDRDVDLAVVISRAADRAQSTVARVLDRAREFGLNRA